MKAIYNKATASVFGIETAFHIVSQPVVKDGTIRLTVSYQSPAIKFDKGVLKVFPNPKNKP